LRHPTSRWRYAAAGGAALWTAATGYGRVAAGRHFYTDVLAGAVLGTTVGFLVPKLHEKSGSADEAAEASSGRFVFTLGGEL
ncbi:MAG: phosphatase PAP2 family protein, partial [Myxococcota bacterium]